MAFVYRAERNLHLHSNDGNLGPGSYLGLGGSSGKQISTAPFSTRSPRGSSPSNSFFPGPGEYTAKGQFEDLKKKTVEQTSKHTIESKEMGIFSFLKSQPVAFDSNVDRFKQLGSTKQNVPGPGSYDVSNGPSSTFKSSKPKIEWRQLAVLHLSNSPSIPALNSAFGYEETAGGELIQQRNPERVFTGEREDTVGPGQYEIKGFTERNTGTNWHASRSSRFLFTMSGKQDGKVGPGTYDMLQGAGSTQRAKGTSSFVSSVPKSTLLAKETRSRSPEEDPEDPGPGAYNPRNGAFQERFFPSSIQQFGFTTSRFTQSKDMGTKLGPGQYGDFRQTYKVQVKRKYVPFLSNEKRAQADKNSNTPGPGEYPVKGIKDKVSISSKKWRNQGVFGSTEKRFAQLSSMQTPGPGHYPVHKVPKDPIMKSTSETAQFKKPLGISKKQREIGPGIGEYDQSSNTIQANLQKNVARYASNPILSNSDVMEEREAQKQTLELKKAENYEKYLGPGCYDVDREFDHLDKVNLGNPWTSWDMRFKANLKMGPGPGQYVNKEQNDWNTRTYNLLFIND